MSEVASLFAGREVARLRVEGVPRPQGSKRGFVNRRTGRVQLVEASSDLPAWRALVAYEARSERARARRPLLDGPLWCDATFWLPRPAKPKRPVPGGKPDLDHLVRAAADSLTGAWWIDDALVCEWRARKLYEAPGEPPGVLVVVGLL